jgi:hypothetical protein
LIGYPLLLVGCIAETFGVHIGTQLTISAMFFELVFPVWLIIKGFRPEAYDAGTLVSGEAAGEALEMAPAVAPRPGMAAL